MHSLMAASRELLLKVDSCTFAEPVTHVYNPLRYAWEQYEQYLSTFGSGNKKVLFLGMNPGPWGMAQTGIPFGEISYVRDWLKISGIVGKPEREHPKRRVEGFACPRSEVSGRRLWSFFAHKFGTPEVFFADNFVTNYCPLVFMEESGKNRTPDKLKPEERSALFDICDTHLIETVLRMQPEWLIGVGGFAEKRFISISGELARRGIRPKIGRILHPSPASPAANRGWSEAVETQLATLSVW